MPEPVIAYFSMEVALESAMPTYAGGLGVLAGDLLKSAAEQGLPMVGITLLHRRGYLAQNFDQSGWQHALPIEWPVAKFLQEVPARVRVEIEDRAVVLRAWRYEVKGVDGLRVPVYFLDADLPENSAWDRTLTHYLYGGDAYYRLCQEVILGIGGVRMLRALGCSSVRRYHLNEGHSSLLTLELLVERAVQAGRTGIVAEDIAAVRRQCIFTTHTPVPSGHDQFPMDLVGRVLHRGQGYFTVQGVFCNEVLAQILQEEAGGTTPADIFRADLVLNLTYLALNLSHYVNGVAKRHAEVSRHMFAKYQIHDITNGVHAARWVSPPLHQLYDRHIPGWEMDNFSLRSALNLPANELWAAHMAAKQAMIAHVRSAAGVSLDPEILTLGFARRFAPYKRADLLLRDLPRLRAIARDHGNLQVIYAGKAHPNDQGGKEIIQHILRLKDQLGPEVRIAFLADYDLDTAALLVAGADVWLNTPLPPMEASGTSGMKAALNGVPSLSTLDGWWAEGCVEAVTGWSIGDGCPRPMPEADCNRQDADSLYTKLETLVCPVFYRDRPAFLSMMKHAIALNGSFFNAQRMVQQYALKAYLS